MMEKFGQYWGRILGDVMHVKRHSDEFHEALTPEESEAWKLEMGDMSMWFVFKEFMRQKKEQRKEAKAALREAKKQDMDPANHPYFQDILNTVKESGLADGGQEYSEEEMKEILKDLGKQTEEEA